MRRPTPPSIPDEPPAEVVPPEVSMPTTVVVWTGMALWTVALVVLLVLPDLRSGERSWWLWVPITGLVVGGLGAAYLRRGRGNAADAHFGD